MLLYCTKHLHLSAAPGWCSQPNEQYSDTNSKQTTHLTMYLSNPSPNQFQSLRRPHWRIPAAYNLQNTPVSPTTCSIPRHARLYTTKREAERTVSTFLSSFSVADGDTPRMSYSLVSATFAMSADRCSSCARRSWERGKRLRDVTCAPPSRWLRRARARLLSCCHCATVRLINNHVSFLDTK